MWIKGVGVAIGLTFALATGLAIPVTTCAQAQVKLAVAGLFALLFAAYTLLLGWGAPRPTEPPP